MSHAAKTFQRWLPIAAVITAFCVSPECRPADGNAQRGFTLVTRHGSTVEVSRADWGKLPRTTVEAVDKQGVTGKYEGVAMSELMKLAAVPTGEKLRGDWLRCYVVVEASDNYQAIYALPELDPAFSKTTVILADKRDGAALGEKNGPFQVIAPGDKRGARWVKMVTRIKVVDHDPNAPAAKYKE
jgi:DMSO/TMAO reductase YedYZ molybdopterin-dependent catalytic subunit